MCIIAVKNKGVQAPSKEILMNCFRHNPDGCGYMYSKGGSVYIRKGFMEFEDFWASYEKVCKTLDVVETPFIFHFRISTQGGVQKGLTHPFPVTDDPNDIMKTRIKCSLGVAHNGIIDLTSDFVSKKSKYSDTQLFIMDYLYKINSLNHGWYKRKVGLELVENLIDSKLAILDSEGYVETIGEFTLDNGILYSNTTYKQTRYTYSKQWESYLNSLYDDDEYEWQYNRNPPSDYKTTYITKSEERKAVMPLLEEDIYYIKLQGEEEFMVGDGLDWGLSEDFGLYYLTYDGSKLVAERFGTVESIFTEEGKDVKFNPNEAESAILY